MKLIFRQYGGALIAVAVAVVLIGIMTAGASGMGGGLDKIAGNFIGESTALAMGSVSPSLGYTQYKNIKLPTAQLRSELSFTAGEKYYVDSCFEVTEGDDSSEVTVYKIYKTTGVEERIYDQDSRAYMIFPEAGIYTLYVQTQTNGKANYEKIKCPVNPREN